MSAPYLGDFQEDVTLDFKWSTNDASGASITRATDGTVSVYKANGVTQSVVGITDTEDFDSLTGIHHCRIDLSADAFYAIANDYQVVLIGAVIDSQTVNAVIAHFSIENRAGSAILSLLDDARGEPGQGAPPVNPDHVTKVDYIYKFLRNLITNDGTDIKVFNNAGDTVDHKAPVSESGGTVTRGKFITGP